MACRRRWLERRVAGSVTEKIRSSHVFGALVGRRKAWTLNGDCGAVGWLMETKPGRGMRPKFETFDGLTSTRGEIRSAQGSGVGDLHRLAIHGWFCCDESLLERSLSMAVVKDRPKIKRYMSPTSIVSPCDLQRILGGSRLRRLGSQNPKWEGPNVILLPRYKPRYKPQYKRHAESQTQNPLNRQPIYLHRPTGLFSSSS